MYISQHSYCVMRNIKMPAIYKETDAAIYRGLS